jgi:hypothetical protein
VVPDVLKECSAFIFKGQTVQEEQKMKVYVPLKYQKTLTQ